MIEEIKGNLRRIKEEGINPNVIRMHPADFDKLKREVPERNIIEPQIFGMEIVPTTRVKEGTAEIYDKYKSAEHKVNIKETKKFEQ